MKTLILTLLSALFVFTTQAHAKKDKAGKGLGLKKVLADIELSEEQKKKIEDIKKSSKKDMKSLKKDLDQAQKDLQEGWKSQADDKKMKDLHSKFHELTMKRMNNRFENMLAVRALLTKDQKAQFAEKMASHKMKMKMKMKKKGKK